MVIDLLTSIKSNPVVNNNFLTNELRFTNNIRLDFEN